MFSGTNEITKCAVDDAVHLGHFRRDEAVGAEESINFVGGFDHFKLANGICPKVFSGTTEQDRARCAQRDQTMLVERQTFRLVVELLKLSALNQ